MIDPKPVPQLGRCEKCGGSTDYRLLGHGLCRCEKPVVPDPLSQTISAQQSNYTVASGYTGPAIVDFSSSGTQPGPSCTVCGTPMIPCFGCPSCVSSSGLTGGAQPGKDERELSEQEWNQIFSDRQKFIREWGEKNDLPNMGPVMLDMFLTFWAELSQSGRARSSPPESTGPEPHSSVVYTDLKVRCHECDQAVIWRYLDEKDEIEFLHECTAGAEPATGIKFAAPMCKVCGETCCSAHNPKVGIKSKEAACECEPPKSDDDQNYVCPVHSESKEEQEEVMPSDAFDSMPMPKMPIKPCDVVGAHGATETSEAALAPLEGSAREFAKKWLADHQLEPIKCDNCGEALSYWPMAYAMTYYCPKSPYGTWGHVYTLSVGGKNKEYERYADFAEAYAREYASSSNAALQDEVDHQKDNYSELERDANRIISALEGRLREWQATVGALQQELGRINGKHQDLIHMPQNQLIAQFDAEIKELRAERDRLQEALTLRDVMLERLVEFNERLDWPEDIAREVGKLAVEVEQLFVARAALADPGKG